MSYIFCGCEKLISVEYYNKNDINKELIIDSKANHSIIDDDSNFYKSTSQSSFETRINQCNSNFLLGNENLKDFFPLLFLRLNAIHGMFSGCKSLISLPNISYWDTSNVQDMSGIFLECESLIALPYISNWNTKNVKYMTNLFSECKSLTSLSDISKWNTSNVQNMKYMFSDCNSLTTLYV